ncbi:GNAT family N-acetyltransferase [Dongia sp.]|uniref:GNAT family N-acetyltransferase n=1 Tax=Dongia sp. TaxID=1977262 RepID=UPI00375151F3
MSVTLRPAAAEDLATLREIYAGHVLNGAASFEEVPPDLAEFERRWRSIAELGLPYLVACEAERVLGYAYAGPYRPRSAYRFSVEDSVYLDPAATGRGIGRQLLAAIIDGATAAGKRQMLAVIGDSANRASIALHAGLGFTAVGTFRAVGFKFGRWVDTVLMQRALGEGDASLPGQ